MNHSFYAKFFHENKTRIICYILVICVASIQKILVPHFYGKILGHFNKNDYTQAQHSFYILIGVWILFQSIEGIVNWFESRLIPNLQNSARQYMGEIIIQKYKDDFRELDLGKLSSKMIKFPESNRELFSKTKTFVFTHFLGSMITLIYIFFLSWKLGIVVLLSFATVLYVSYLFFKNCSKVALQREEIFDDTYEEIQDTFSNLIAIYTNRKEKDEIRRLKTFNDRCETQHVQSFHCVSFYRSIYSVLFMLLFVGYNYVSFYLYEKNEISISSLTSIFIITYILLGNMMNFMNDTNAFIYSWTKMKSVFVEDYVPKNEEVLTPIDIQDYTIHIKNVSYAKIIHNISILIRPREHVLILGPIGSGKSTLVHLMYRLIPMNSEGGGHILIGGHDIQDISIPQLRSLICFVPQSPKLFNRILEENLKYGIEDSFNMERILEILDSVHLNKLASIFRKRQYEQVGKQGSLFSGGQRQIIWIIKAILGDFPIVILDEPTSSLDDTTRNAVLRLIRLYLTDRTVIIISHDKEMKHHVHRTIHL